MASEPDSLDLPKLVTILASGVAVTLIAIVGMQALYWAGERWQFEAKDLPYTYEKRVEQETAQKLELINEGWVDQDTGIVHIPIDDAMSIIVDEQR